MKETIKVKNVYKGSSEDEMKREVTKKIEKIINIENKIKSA